VLSLDSFLLNQLTLDPDVVHDVFAEIEADMHRPPMTINDVLDALDQHAPGIVTAMRAEVGGR